MYIMGMMKMINYTIEKFENVLPELKELVKEHYEESAFYKDIPLNVDWELMMRLEQFGDFKLFVVKKDSKVIGYATFVLSNSIEYKDSFQASMQNIFIHPN